MRKAKILKAIERTWLVLALIPFVISFPHYFKTLRETSPFSLDSIIFTASYLFLFSPTLYARYWRDSLEKGKDETKGQKIKRALCLFALMALVLGVTWLGLRAGLR